MIHEGMSELPPRTDPIYSPDGTQWWDGSGWQPVSPQDGGTAPPDLARIRQLLDAQLAAQQRQTELANQAERWRAFRAIGCLSIVIIVLIWWLVAHH
jgi:hypothetical protein